MSEFIVGDYHKGLDAVADTETCYDKPNQKQKPPVYESKIIKMMRKNHEFSDKKFQKIRHISSKKEIIKSFQRIGRCLNNVSRDEIPKNGYDNVCLVLINSIEHKKHDPKVGALNDGYLFALHHHRLGFKVFYLYNCMQGNYPKFLRFFLYNTTNCLSVYYSGPGQTERGDNGVTFKDTYLTAYQLGHVISQDNNGKCKVIFVSDCASSGSVFDISRVGNVGNMNPSQMISLSTSKSNHPDSKEGRRAHGLLTYYFCKVIYDNPAISVQRCVERINNFIDRFGQKVNCEITHPSMLNDSIYKPCHHPHINAEEDSNESSQSLNDGTGSSLDEKAKIN